MNTSEDEVRAPSEWRKKPVVVQAAQWFKHGDHPAVGEYMGGVYCKACTRVFREHGWIETLEGGHVVCPGAWIITGVKGEQYPCKPDIFAVTYEPANAEPSRAPGVGEAPLGWVVVYNNGKGDRDVSRGKFYDLDSYEAAEKHAHDGNAGDSSYLYTIVQVCEVWEGPLGYVVVGENASRLWIVVPGDGDIRQGSRLLTKADAGSLVAHMTAAQFPGCTYRAVPLPGLSAVPETTEEP